MAAKPNDLTVTQCRDCAANTLAERIGASTANGGSFSFPKRGNKSSAFIRHDNRAGKLTSIGVQVMLLTEYRLCLRSRGYGYGIQVMYAAE